MVLRYERIRVAVGSSNGARLRRGHNADRRKRDPWPTNDGIALVVLGAYAGVGYVIARAEPRNPIGWIFLGLGFFTRPTMWSASTSFSTTGSTAAGCRWAAWRCSGRKLVAVSADLRLAGASCSRTAASRGGGGGCCTSTQARRSLHGSFVHGAGDLRRVRAVVVDIAEPSQMTTEGRSQPRAGYSGRLPSAAGSRSSGARSPHGDHRPESAGRS